MLQWALTYSIVSVWERRDRKKESIKTFQREKFLSNIYPDLFPVHHPISVHKYKLPCIGWLFLASIDFRYLTTIVGLWLLNSCCYIVYHRLHLGMKIHLKKNYKSEYIVSDWIFSRIFTVWNIQHSHAIEWLEHRISNGAVRTF